MKKFNEALVKRTTGGSRFAQKVDIAPNYFINFLLKNRVYLNNSRAFLRFCFHFLAKC